MMTLTTIFNTNLLFHCSKGSGNTLYDMYQEKKEHHVNTVSDVDELSSKGGCFGLVSLSKLRLLSFSKASKNAAINLA
jgi:hypothetical protein